MKPIILTGFMGCGKSTLGRLLAQKMQYRFLDSDAVIEQKAGMTVTELFEQRGEQAFRRLETRVLEELLQQTSLVLATGGGIVLEKENRDLLLNKGLVIFLKAQPETVFQRVLQSSHRPLAKGKSLKELSALYQSRMPLYEQCHICYEEFDKSPLQCVNELMAILKEEGYGN